LAERFVKRLSDALIGRLRERADAGLALFSPYILTAPEGSSKARA